MAHNTIDELKTDMLKQPDSFAYFGELDLTRWGFFMTKHRDSELLELSNYDAALAMLKAADESAVDIMHCSHWAYGHCDHIMLDTQSDKVMAVALDIEQRLDDYCILDEEDLSNREYEQASSAYDSWARWDIGRLVEQTGISSLLDSDGDYSPNEEQEEVLRSIVCDAILDNGGTDYCENDLLEKIQEKFAA